MTGPKDGARRGGVRARIARCAFTVCALVACAPAPAPRPEPTATPAGASPFRLPVIGADGAPPAHATIFVPLLPPAEFDTATDGSERGNDEDPWEPEEPKDRSPTASAWPDVDALLDGLSLDHDAADGVVTFSGADDDTAVRVLAAAHAALSRTVHVEVSAVRLAAGERAPSADAVLAARGARVAARIDRVLHDGAVLIDDERETQVFPADADVSDDTIVAHAVAFDVGAYLAVSPARLDAHRHVLRIAFHESRAVSERSIAGDDVARVAPAMTVTALLLSAPAVSGRADVAVAEAADGRPGVAVAWRVTTVNDPAPPPGASVVSLHVDRPPFACDRPPRVGIVGLTREATDVDDLPDADVPALPADATDGLRVVAAEPGVVVATGAADVLARFDAAVAVRAAERHPAARFRRGGTSIPLVRDGDTVLVQGRLDPVVVESDAEIAMSDAGVATRTWWVFTGRSLRITAEPGGARVDASSAPAPEIAPSMSSSVRNAFATDPVTHDVVDAVTVRSVDAVRHLVVGAAPETPAEDDTLEILAW